MRAGLHLLILAVALLLAACAGKQPSPSSPRPVPATEATAKQKVAAHLRAERFEAALMVIREERREKRSSRLLEEDYLQALQALTATGEKYFQRGEYQLAGKSFRLLLDHFPPERTLAGRLPVSRDGATKRLQASADRLMDNGLAEYRAGNLQKAIDIWKGILAFQPAHDGAKKAIHTADTQLKNLRALP